MDFKIKLNTELNSEKAEAQLAELQTQANKKPIKLDTQLNLKDFSSQVSELSKTLNNSFKFNGDQVKDLKEIKKLIQEIDKINKGSTKPVKSNEELEKTRNLIKQFDLLQSKQRAIEKQMSKTTNSQSYAVLSKELVRVREEAEKVAIKLDSIGKVKGSTNITNSLAATFQSINKQIDSTETKINKLLKNKNLGLEQRNSLEQLKQEIESLRGVNLDSIVNADKSYAEMSKLVRGVQDLKNDLNNLNIDIGFNDKLIKSESIINNLISKFKLLSESGFSNKSEINNLINRLEELKSSLGNINVGSAGASSQLKEIDSSIKECLNSYNQLSKETNGEKLQFNFDTKLNKTIADLQLLRSKCEQLGSGVDEVNRLENEVQKLNDLSLDRATSELARIRSEMGEVGSANGLIKQFDLLQSKQVSIEKQMSKTTNVQSYSALYMELIKIREEAEKVATKLDKVNTTKGNLDITKNLASTFQNVNKQIDSTEIKINKLLKNKNLGSEQLNSLEQLKQELQSLRSIDLDSILNANESYAEMSKLLKGVQELKNDLNNLNIDISFNDKLMKVQANVENLISKFKILNESGFSNKSEISNTVNKLEELKSSLSNMNIGSPNANSQLRDIENFIENCLHTYTQLSNETKNNKLKFEFDTKFNKTVSDLQSLKSLCEEMGSEVNEVSRLEKELQNLSNLDLDRATSELNRLRSGMNDIGNLKNLIKEYDKLQAKQLSIEKQMSKTTNSQSYEVLSTELLKARNEAEKVASKLDKISTTKVNLDLTKNLASTFQNVSKQIETTETKINGILKNKNLGSEQLSSLKKLKNELESLKNVNLDTIIKSDKPYSEMSKLLKGVQELKSNLNNLNIDISFNDKLIKTESIIDNLISKFKTLGQSGFADKGEISSTLSKLEELKSSLNNIDIGSSNASSQLKEIENSIRNCLNAYETLSDATRSDQLQFDFDTKLDKTIADLQLLRNKCEQLGTGTEEINRLENELRNLGNLDLDRATSELTRLRSEMSSFGKELNLADKGLKGSSLANGSGSGFFSELYQTISTFSLGNIIADQMQQGIYAIKDTIIEYDNAFRDLMKVAPESFQGTKEQLNELRDNAVAAGQEVARSSVDIIQSTANALQSGFKNVNEALKYAKESSKFANVSDMDQGSADMVLRSILSSYGGVENSLKGVRTEIRGATNDYSMLNQVMDAANYIGNNYSTSTKNVAEGMQNAGASLKTMGASVTDGMAYFTAIDEVMQNSQKSSNGLKAIAQNLTGITVSAKDGSLKLNKSALALKEYASIDVQKPNGELRDMGEVLDELGGKWKDLNKTQKQALMVAIGGKQRSSQFSALMDNWETVKKIQQEIAGGAALGSADAENARYVDSIEGRIVRLKEELKKLVTTTISTDFFKGLVSGFTGFVSILNKVIGTLDRFGVSTPVMVGAITSIVTAIKALGNKKDIPNFGKIIFDSFKGTEDKVDNVKKSIEDVVDSSKKCGDSLADMSNKAGENTEKAAKSADKLSKGFLKTKLKSVAANVGISLLNAGMVAFAGIAINLAVRGIDNFVNRSEKLAEASRKRQAEIQGEIDATKQQVSSLESIADEYDTLSKKTNKSQEELKRFNELKQEIATISPELVVGYDADNNPILAINGSLEETIKLKKEILRLDQESLLAEQKKEIEANRDKANRVLEDTSYYKDKYSGGNDKTGNPRDDAFSTVLYRDDIKKYLKYLSSKKEAYNNYINEMSKARSDYFALESKAKQVAITELNNSLSDKNLKDNTIENINSLAGSFSWGNLSAGETVRVQQAFEGLNNSFAKFDTQSFQTKVSNLAKDLEAGSISQEQYEKGMSNLADTLIQAGIDVDKSTLLKALKQFPPELREIDYAMADILKSVGLKVSDLGSNVKADMLYNQMEYMSKLTEKFAGSMEETGTIAVHLIPEIDGEIYNLLPTQIQGAIDAIMADGEVSEQEAEILMKLMTSWEQDGEISEDEINELIKLKELDGEVITQEIETKLTSSMDDDYKKYVINSTEEGNKLNKTITARFKAEGQDEYSQAYEKAGVDPNSEEGKEIKNEIDAKFEQEGFETSQKVVEVMETLGLTTGEEQSSFLSVIEAQIKSGNMNLGNLKSAKDILSWLLDHPEIINQLKLEILGKKPLEEIKKNLDGLDLGEKEKKSIIVDIQKGNLPGLQQTINKLPKEKRTQVIMEIGEALTNIGTVEAITLRDKIAKIFGIDLSKGTVDNSDNYKQTMNKDINIGANDKSKGTVDSSDSYKKEMLKEIIIEAIDNATSVINRVGAISPPSIFVSIIGKLVGSAWNWVTGRGRSKPKFSGGSGGHATMSVNEIENKPQTFANNPINENAKTPSNSANVENQVSPMSVGSFDKVLTDATLATKISISLTNVWNTIKYGINLFQELENRISRTQNQIDLLALKMENAVGTKRISYLKTQNKLYAEQAKLQKTLFDSLYKKKQNVQSKLKGYGFGVDKQGNLTSYEEQLVKLEQAAEAAEKKASGYKGKSDKTKNSLEKAAEKARQKLEDAKKLTEEYLDLQYTKIPNAEQEWHKLQNAIKETNDEIERLEFENKIYKQKNAIEELNYAMEQYSHYQDRAATKAERFQGKNKIKYLKEELKHLKELQNINNQLALQYSSQRTQYKKKLGAYGFKFDEKNGKVTNYDDILNKYQNSDDLEKIKEWVEEYQELTDLHRDANDLKEEHINNIQDLDNEIKQLELEEEIFPFNTAVEESNSKIEKLQNSLDIIGIKMEHAYGTDKLNLIKEQIRLYEQLEQEQQKQLENMKKQESIFKNELRKNGFKFDDNGDISNMEVALSNLKNSSAYEYVMSVLEQWKELHENEIPEAIESIEDYDSAIKDAMKDQLDITKDMEDKISEMIKKQIEDRKDAIEKETETITSELEKRKKAYQDERKEAEYKNDYEEKTDEISKLEKELENAKKDTSLGNKKKIAELEKQLADAKKDLDKFVQDKIDSDIEDSFDEAIKDAEDKNDSKIEELEKEWTDSKISEVIKEALSTGVFTDLDGNITSLQDAMLEFAETSGDALGVMGNIKALYI